MSLPNIELLALPPRKVPLPVRCHQAFGGGLNQIGWWLTAFCTPFFWLFFMDCEIVASPRFLGSLNSCQGTITRSHETNGSEGDVQIYANHYTFSLKGREYNGCSYATGNGLAVNSAVTIEYASSVPTVSRIRGMRSRRFGMAAALVILFPLIGIGVLGFGWVRGKRARRLLECGALAGGILKSTEKTGVEVNDQPVYKFHFAFTAADGKDYTASASTHETTKFVDEAAEQLLYDPNDPSYAMLADDLPVPVRIDNLGELHPVSSRRALLAMIMPLLTIAGNVLWTWTWLLA